MGHCFAMIEDNYQALQSYQQALGITPESQVPKSFVMLKPNVFT